MTEETKETLLELDELKVYFYTEDGVVKAVDGCLLYTSPSPRDPL